MDVKQLKNSVREIQEDKSKAKNLLDIVPLLKNAEEKKCPKLKVVHALQKALSHVIKRGEINQKAKPPVSIRQNSFLRFLWIFSHSNFWKF